LTEHPLHPPVGLSNLLVLRSNVARVFAIAFISLNTLISTSSLVLSLLRRPQRYELGTGQRAAVFRPKSVLLKIARTPFEICGRLTEDLPETGEAWWAAVVAPTRFNNNESHNAVIMACAPATCTLGRLTTIATPSWSESLRLVRCARRAPTKGSARIATRPIDPIFVTSHTPLAATS